MNTELFQLGKVIATRAAIEKVDHFKMTRMLRRHRKCDWGCVHPDDAEVNNEALTYGGRLWSAYLIDANKPNSIDNKVWVITEADRSVTTFLLPSDY